MIVRKGEGRRPGYAAAALVFTIGVAGTTLPTPLYGSTRRRSASPS